MEPYQNPALSPERRAEDLLPRMTLREKVGQLTQRLYGFAAYTRQGGQITLSDEFCQEVQYFGGIGALYGLYRADPWSARDYETGLEGALAPRARNMAQRYVISHSRFGIPMLMSSECPHGHQGLDGYLLPVNLATGCTFAPELLEQAARVSGRQLKEMGVDLALVSALDVVRDPRWGRSEECFSEDPLLTSRMATAVVRGIQSQGVDVTAKHLCAQGETTGGINASAARIGQRELREIHLPPVKACVEAGVASFMAAYNEIDGVYCHGNRSLLTDLLRGEYGFQGFVMSDGCAVDQLDAVTGDRTASGALALHAGVDMGLWDTGFQQLEEAVTRGLVDEEELDQAVKRVLILKFRRGLFEHPYVPETGDWARFNSDLTATRTLAEQSMVLLKNQGNLLPLDRSRPLRLLLTGPNADDMYHQLGDYTPPMRPGVGSTPKTGLEAFLDQGQLIYRRGCPMFQQEDGELDQAVEAARQCDVTVAVLGGSSSRFSLAGEFDANGAMKKQHQVTMDCGENVDAAALRLPGDQLELLRRLKAVGKPVVTVLIGGRPYEMEEIARLSDGLLCCFYPGPAGGEALARLLFGEIAPGGRLSVSLPDTADQLPVYYNPKDSYRAGAYYDRTRDPGYSFGDGLTYTEFGYQVTRTPDGTCNRLEFTIANLGSRGAYAVPQLYIHRMQGVVTSRQRQLCDFTKVYLDPGAKCQVTLEVPPEALEQWDSAMHRVTPPGRVECFLRDNGRDYWTGAFAVK